MKSFCKSFVFIFFLLIWHESLQCAIDIKYKVGSVIQGADTGLVRPEGVSFSPSGDCVAIANAEGHSITLYRRIGTGAKYENTPFCVIHGPDSFLYYPHDVTFSPDGNHLAVANRYANCVTVYKKVPNGMFSSLPIAVIQGEYSDLKGVGGIAYSPTKKLLAIASSYDNSLAFCRYQGDIYDPFPCTTIDSSYLLIPDGIAFSKEGSLLVLPCHNSNTVVVYKMSEITPQINSEQFRKTLDPAQVIDGYEAHLVYPHSVNFHPSNRFVALTSSGGFSINFIEISEKEGAWLENSPFEKIDISNGPLLRAQKTRPDSCGAKGVAFSRDGKVLAACVPEILGTDKVIFFELEVSISE